MQKKLTSPPRIVNVAMLRKYFLEVVIVPTDCSVSFCSTVSKKHQLFVVLHEIATAGSVRPHSGA
jgi:hypothetical protein